MDRIRIDKLTCYGYHGALPEENRLGQNYQASIEVELDLHPAGSSDDLTRTVDYQQIVAIAEKVLSGPPCKLVETLAERIARKILDDFPPVHAVTVEVTKPAPPVPYALSSISAFIRRSR